MKALISTGLVLAASAFLIAGCGGQAAVSDANYATVQDAQTAITAEECTCLVSQGQYASDVDCLATRFAAKSDAWLGCANSVVASGRHGDAMACLAEAYAMSLACVEAEPCNGTTYPLSVQACVAQYTGTPDCPGLEAANEAIETECSEIPDDGGGTGNAPGSRRLGELCLADVDCISGFCLESEYGAPFCTRTCDEPQVDCPAGDDAEIGESLCVSFAKDQLPYPELVDDFQGDVDTFCVPRCGDLSACREKNESWETCSTPKYKGNEIYPGLGAGGNICQAPSHHGKDPVDPSECNYEKTIGNFGGEAALCGFYCEFLETCLFIEKDVYPEGCCEWGCFSRMVPESDQVDDAWYDDVKCFVDDHNAWPPVGVDNYCNHPSKACGGNPEDPTHAAAIPK